MSSIAKNQILCKFCWRYHDIVNFISKENSLRVGYFCPKKSIKQTPGFIQLEYNKYSSKVDYHQQGIVEWRGKILYDFPEPIKSGDQGSLF